MTISTRRDGRTRSTPPRLWLAVALALLTLTLTACGDPVSSLSDQPESTEHAHEDERNQPGDDSLLPVTLTEWLYSPSVSPATGEPLGVAHLTIAPLAPGPNTIDIALTDLQGAALPVTAEPAEATLTIRPLVPESEPVMPPLTRDPDNIASWSAGEVDLPEGGWYELGITLEAGDGVVGASTMYALLPDPSVHGSAALELPESNSDAQALYDRALSRYAGWDAVRWRESLGSGSDVLVVTDFMLTNRPGEIPAFMVESRYTAAFRDGTDGTSPDSPSFDVSESITIGDTAWRRREDSDWEQVSTLGVSTQADRADIFTGAASFQLGGTARVDGRDVDVITFYLPHRNGQSEAWFAWWLDAGTGDPIRIAMVAQMHFMIWDFFDIDGSYTITPPSGVPAATPADIS